MEMVVYREENEKIQKIRPVLGDIPEQHILRALSLSGNNPDAAINLILDTPGFMASPVTVKRTLTSTGARVSTQIKREMDDDDDDESLDDDPYCQKPKKVQVKEEKSDLSLALVPVVKEEPVDLELDRSQPLNPKKEPKNEDLMMGLERKRSSPSGPSPYSRAITPLNVKQGKQETQMTCYEPIDDGEFPEEPDYVLLGRTVVMGLSTCKRRKLDFNEIVYFTYPSPRAKANFVRFSTKRSGEIGRLPIEWTRNILYLVNCSKVKLCGRYVAAPMELHMMQDIHLFISIYVHCSVFTEGNTTTSMSSPPAYSWSIEHPLPSLIRLLEIKPFKQAELNSEELDNRKRSLNLKAGAVVSNAKRAKGNHPANQFTEKNTEEQTITESMLNKLIGAAEVYNLEEKDPPETLTCVLHPYQKQALYWMSGSEEGFDVENAANTLHPCWEVYRLTDRRASDIYINIFSGEATTRFPKATQIARGGILADAMGLGKTVMTIALILARQGRGIPGNQLIIREDPDQLRRRRSPSRAQGGTLIVCPMALLGQWKDELETHSQPGTLQVSVQYGVDRTSDPEVMSKHDVVLTTYGVLSQAYKMDREESIFHQVDWFRVVLDEAHTIKSSKTQVAQASFSLSSYCRWCLTGTPLQNSLEDLYSLLHFLRVEPWCNWAWWQKLIQKPYEAGDERGLKLVKAILRPLMLRRTKDTKDKYGRPILVLPAADIGVIKCEQSEVERDFYDALFKRSKIQFEHFVAQGNVLNNYAYILELLLRLRQCCNHPFLVMGRADSIKYVDVNELARRFLEPNTNSKPMPTPAFVEEVVEGIRRGETSECPICLESADDPVLTPCAHRMCRECLITSWSTPSSGICPICRQKLNKSDLISCPTGKKVQLDAENNWKESCKVVKLLDCLETLRKSGSGEKSIVFSQWTSFFDLLEIPLRKKGIRFLRFDGKLSQKNRENVLKEFSETNEKMVLLMSLKAGGVGLNLTMASNVFLMDPWWNPAVEEQAIMRIHRIGQKRVVAVRRFIVKNTVEDRMQQVQARKQRMISGALTDEEIRETRIEDLKMLFS